MDKLKAIFAPLKQHYEKALLGFVLLALFIAAGWLFFKLDDEQSKLKALHDVRAKLKGKEAKPTDLARHEAAFQISRNPPLIDLSKPHNLLNPVKWQQRGDGALLKIQTGKEEGVGALVVTNITPLLYVVNFERAAASGYFVGELNEADPNPRRRAKAQVFVGLNAPVTGKTFVLKQVNGPPEDPSELVFEFAELGKASISISKDSPYVRTNSYKADMVYPPLNKAFRELRIDSKIPLESDEYKVVGITSSNVIVSAKSNDKRTTIPFNAVP